MKNEGFMLNKNLRSLLIVLIISFITFSLISGSTPSISIINESYKKNINVIKYDEGISDGLAPDIRNNMIPFNEKSICKEKASIIEDCPLMYGLSAYPTESIVSINTCNCGMKEICQLWGGGFFSAGTYGCDGVWYVTEYSNGVLYGINPFNCTCWSIGGGGASINALAYDPITKRMFGVCNSDNLWEINPDTGEQELIGLINYSGGYMIGMAFDAWGQLYGWDIVLDTLWKIDYEEPSARGIGCLGININYAQDGDFHRESDQLYLTAYTSSGGLYKCDKETGQCELVCSFQNEITASVFFNNCVLPDHDVSVESIDYPQNGYAIPEIPMQVTVQNLGNNTEITDVQTQVIRYEAGSVIMEEDFSGTFPPDGWKTDFWNKSDTNNSGGTAPEAIVYKYDQYNGGQYYDNYIMTGQIDCTGLEKVTLRFRWAGDYDYPQYPSVYVKFRRNSTSTWEDFTPWYNPIGINQLPQLWETSCYSFDEPFGDEFQVKWLYLGYYGYYNSLWLDDIEIIAYNRFEEYNETVEGLEIEKGEEVIVDFPNWTPSDWQNPDYENVWQDYRVKACTLLEDDRPNNDCKDKLIDLYFPWFDDVEVKSIDSPCEDGPGKTYPVKATIKNVGQNSECCIPINISIVEQFIIETLLEESSWPNPYPEVPADGWTDEHKLIAYYYGWRKSKTSFSEGFIPEAYIYYSYCREDYHFYSYAIDTSTYNSLRLRFKTYINHYSGQGLYSLEAGYSTDKETWYAVWDVKPNSDGKYEVDVPIEVSSDIIYIGFWVKGDPYYFNYWYIDDVELIATKFIEEYSDHACQGPDIEPGEEVTIEFDDWTPEFLQNETTGTKEYIIKCSIEMEGDKNPDNDNKTEMFMLNYWHDVGIDRVTSPVGEGNPREKYEFLWDNGEPDGRNALQGSMYQGYSNIIIDDFQAEEDWYIQFGILHFIWNSGYGPGNIELIRVYLFEDQGDCDPSLDEYPEPDYVFEASTFTEEVGGTYFSRPEIIVDFLLDEEVSIPAGNWYIGIQPEGLTDVAYILTAESKGCGVMADLPYWGYPRWTSSQEIWDEQYDIAWKLGWQTCLPSPNAYIKPGIQDIDAVAKNYGTFPKEDLNCYAEIREYITDPEYGTIVYTDEIGNIDLSEPLGGEKEIQFDDFTFTDEGRYKLFLDLPTSPDDKQKNNKITWQISVDDTKPQSDYPPILIPKEPTGYNGWYVDDVEVTLNATDPWSHAVSSGIKEIRYTINGGAEQVIPGRTGSYILDKDGELFIEYWAIDYVGNVETPKNEFSVKIDKTSPDVTLDYEVAGGNPLTGWELTFTATAIDNTSGMDYVEFYYNDELQETITGPGPTYQWTYTYFEEINTIIKVIAYDKAGNDNSDQIEDPTVCTHNTPKINQIKSRSYYFFKIPRVK